LKNIDVKVEDEDEALILLWLLPTSHDYFVDTLLYKKGNPSSEDIKASLNSKELKRKRVLWSHNDNHIEGLIVKGRTNNKGSSSACMLD
jgi:hypothetical protein